MPPATRLAEFAGETTPLKPRDIGPPSSSSQTLLLFLALLLLATSATLLVLRIRNRNIPISDSQPLEYLILESTISIEIGDEGFELEYSDDNGSPTGRVSYETILNSATPQQLTFDIDKIPTLYERRGRRVLKLRPAETGDADMALIDIKEGRLTVSPFSSRRDGVRVVTEFPPARRRTPRGYEGHEFGRSGIATAPHQLQSSWRPLDSAELPDE